jgi:hypothetical protein
MTELTTRWEAARARTAELLVQTAVLLDDRARLQRANEALLHRFMQQARTFVDEASAIEP